MSSYPLLFHLHFLTGTNQQSGICLHPTSVCTFFTFLYSQIGWKPMDRVKATSSLLRCLCLHNERSYLIMIFISRDEIVRCKERVVPPNALTRGSTIPEPSNMENICSAVAYLSVPPSSFYSFLKDLHLFTDLDPVTAILNISTGQPNSHRLRGPQAIF